MTGRFVLLGLGVLPSSDELDRVLFLHLLGQLVRVGTQSTDGAIGQFMPVLQPIHAALENQMASAVWDAIDQPVEPREASRLYVFAEGRELAFQVEQVHQQGPHLAAILRANDPRRPGNVYVLIAIRQQSGWEPIVQDGKPCLIWQPATAPVEFQLSTTF